MDKFLEQIEMNREKQFKIKKIINDNKKKMKKLSDMKSNIEKKINSLNATRKQNDLIINGIVNFKSFKNRIMLLALLTFLITALPTIIVAVIPAFLLNSLILKVISILFLIISGVMIGKKSYKTITDEKEMLSKYSIEKLEIDNSKLEISKKKLNNKKREIIFFINYIEELNVRHNDNLIDLQKNIEFIENIRSESINKLCTEILDRQFEIEQSNPSFQKVIKPNHKQIN